MKPFRFGVVAGRPTTGADWTALARVVQDRGFVTLLVPDRRGMAMPTLPALGAAAVATERLRLGSWVLAVGRHDPADVAWAVSCLDLLSGGRVELGVGAGLAPPASADQVAGFLDALGRPPADAVSGQGVPVPGARTRRVTSARAASSSSGG